MTNAYVAPEHRNQGVGRGLLDAVIAEARADHWQLLILWPSDLSGEFYARADFHASAEALELELASTSRADE